MTDYSTMTMTQVARLEGVNNLPTIAKRKFAAAIIQEAKGNDEKAHKLLDSAIEAEAQDR